MTSISMTADRNISSENERVLPHQIGTLEDFLHDKDSKSVMCHVKVNLRKNSVFSLHNFIWSGSYRTHLSHWPLSRWSLTAKETTRRRRRDSPCYVTISVAWISATSKLSLRPRATMVMISYVVLCLGSPPLSRTKKQALCVCMWKYPNSWDSVFTQTCNWRYVTTS